MKKIIVLVLSVVLCCALCVCAFGANSYSINKDSNFSKVLYRAADGKFVDRYIEASSSDVYVAVYNGDYDLYINGTATENNSNVKVSLAENYNNGKYSVVVSEYQVPVKADWVCCSIVSGIDFVDANGNYYTYANEDTEKEIYANYDNMIVVLEKITLDLDNIVNHKLVASYDDNGKVNGFTCTICDANLTYTTSKMEALTSNCIFDTVNVGGTNYYVYYHSVAVASNTNIASAKTADTGILGYAIMGITSLGGMAYVGGKKKGC